LTVLLADHATPPAVSCSCVPSAELELEMSVGDGMKMIIFGRGLRAGTYAPPFAK